MGENILSLAINYIGLKISSLLATFYFIISIDWVFENSFGLIVVFCILCNNSFLAYILGDIFFSEDYLYS